MMTHDEDVQNEKGCASPLESLLKEVLQIEPKDHPNPINLVILQLPRKGTWHFGGHTVKEDCKKVHQFNLHGPYVRRQKSLRKREGTFVPCTWRIKFGN
jgi:hypothetical protein